MPAAGAVLRLRLSVAGLAGAREGRGVQTKRRLRPVPCYCPRCGREAGLRPKHCPAEGRRRAALSCLECWLKTGEHVRLALVCTAGAVRLATGREGRV